MTRTTESMKALHAATEDGAIALGAPHIGRFEAYVEEGQLIEGGQLLGMLHILNRRVRVVAPEGATGRVTTRLVQRERAVAYGAALCEVTAVDAMDAAGGDSAANTDDLPEGHFYFRASLDGLFYHAPSPEDPAFAEVGREVAEGDTLGLIEVMKFFYPVVFEQAERCEIVEVLVPDATPVSSGEPLVTLKRLAGS